jgi:hypothetical protein
MNPFPDNIRDSRVMVFIDGENLSIRYGEMLNNEKPLNRVSFVEDVYAWSHFLNLKSHRTCEIVRKYYCT